MAILRHLLGQKLFKALLGHEIFPTKANFAISKLPSAHLRMGLNIRIFKEHGALRSVAQRCALGNKKPTIQTFKQGHGFYFDESWILSILPPCSLHVDNCVPQIYYEEMGWFKFRQVWAYSKSSV